MNRALAYTLSLINGALAVVFILAGAILGAGMIGGLGGLIIGAAGGFLIAASVCGALALLTLIERHLAVLAAASGSNLRAAADQQKTQPTPTRVEPSL